MNIGQLLNSLDDETKLEFRTYEKKVGKLSNAQSRLKFNQLCQLNQLLPKYTHIYIYIYIYTYIYINIYITYDTIVIRI